MNLVREEKRSSRLKGHFTKLLLLVTLSVAALFILTLTTGQRISPTFNTASSTSQSRPEPKRYPENLKLAVLSARLSREYGFQLLRTVPTLRGSFSLSQLQSNQYRKVDANSSSVLQRLTFNGTRPIVVDNYQFPAHQGYGVTAIVAPVFGVDRDHGFVRAVTGDADAPSYSLYEWNLRTRTAQFRVPGITSYGKFDVAPDGNSYAFADFEPYNNAWFYLTVITRSKRHSISHDNISENFCWSPRNTIIYPAHQPKPMRSKEKWYLDDQEPDPKYFGYPNIYEDDLKGKQKLLKRGADRPSISPNGRYLATIDPYGAPKKPLASNEGSVIQYRGRNKAAQSVLVIFDLKTQKNSIVKAIYSTEQYDRSFPNLIWSKDGNRLYIVENSYDAKQKMAHCVVEVFDTQTRRRKVVGRLRQRGEAGESQANFEKFMPQFKPIKIANAKYLLCQVSVRESGQNNQHVLAVDLRDGKRFDILAFTSAESPLEKAQVDWIDSRS